MNLRKLIDFFPYTYKEKDTYKVNGQGILERFLEICGTYLEEYITPDIENELELIDLDKVPPMYLNYLWEYLGSIPFAYGVSIDKEKFDRYYNGLQSKEELEALSKVWTIQKKGPVVLNETKVRNILKYAITLTKIRGTKRFFETIFKLYGFECVVTDPTTGNTTSFNNWVDDKPIFDSEYYKFDTSRFDEDPRCSQCIPVTFDISCVFGFMDINSEYFYDSKAILYCGNYDGLLDLYSKVVDYNNTGVFGFMDINSEYFYDSKAILYCGNYDGLLDLYSKVVDYNNTGRTVVMAESQEQFIQQNEAAIFTGSIPASLSDFIAFRRMMVSFFDRYLPYNVKAKLTFQGYEIDDKISIKVVSSDCYDPEYPNTIFMGRKNYVKYTVGVSSLWSGTDLRYVVSGDGVTWGEPHENFTDITIYISGTYYIKPYTDDYKGEPVILQVNSVMLNTWYTLECITPDGTEFGPGIKSLRVCLRGIKHVENLVDGTIVTTTSSVPIIKILGNTNMVPSPWVDNTTYTVWTFGITDTEDGLGPQKVSFGIQESINKQISLQFTRRPEYAYGSISPITIDYRNTSTKVVTCYPRTNYGDSDLIGYIGMKCIENGLIYGWEDQWVINRDGVTHFEIVRILNGDKKHDARANAIIIENTKDNPTKFSFSVVRTTPLVVYIQPYRDVYYITDANPTASVYCYVNYYGTIPAGTEFNWNLRIYENGVDTGVTINGNPHAYSTYTVDHPCTVRFVSLQDSTIMAESTIIDNRVVHIDNRLVISPEINSEGNWDTNMWETNWADSNEKTSAVAKNGKAKFYLRLYTKEGLVSGAPIEVQDANWTYLSTIETGDLITIDQPGTYYLVHSETNLIVTLTIKSTSPIAVDSISVEDCEVNVSETITPNVTILPAGASDRSYTLSVEDTSKATVVGTHIVGISPGETVLTVKSSNNKTGTSKLIIK